jgi:hypothetical protein
MRKFTGFPIVRTCAQLAGSQGRRIARARGGDDFAGDGRLNGPCSALGKFLLGGRGGWRKNGGVAEFSRAAVWTGPAREKSPLASRYKSKVVVKINCRGSMIR